MVKETLVGIGVEWGSQILGLLDAAKFPIPVAAWVRSAGDDGRLRLLLATPLYDRLGPAKAYLKLVNTLSSSDQIGQIHLSNFKVPGPRWSASCEKLLRGFQRLSGGIWAAGC
jgi:hypothetical protein